jgi:hypothetical protein
MAVNTGEIAEFADVELKDLGAPPAERQTVIAQSPGKSPHGRAVESLRTCHLTIERKSSWIIPQSSGFGAFSFRQQKRRQANTPMVRRMIVPAMRVPQRVRFCHFLRAAPNGMASSTPAMEPFLSTAL